jgi:hypothetical protein
MLFTREGLEMASSEAAAAYHASQFPAGSLVADLTVGIGADLIALAQRGPAIGYELDPEKADYARHNLFDLKAEIRTEDCLSASWDFDYAFADPSRRVGGRRTRNLAEFSPSPIELASRMASLQLGGIKLSPMLADAELSSLGPRLEFLSHEGECKEALVWTGEKAVAGRFAVQAQSREVLEAHEVSSAVDQPRQYLFEADPAAIRAHALGSLCSRFSLECLGDSNGYLTGPEPIASPWLKIYRIVWTGRADLKGTNEALRNLQADRPILKQRGAGLDLESMRKQLKSHGKRELLLAIWPVGSSLRHTLLEKP